MKIQNFEVKIPEGREQDSGHVAMKHNSKYSLSLRNSSRSRCDAVVTIDGKEIGAWRVPARSHIEIERPADDDGCFTFYRAGSKKGKKAGLESVAKCDMGVVSVEFRPEKRRPKVVRSRGPSGSGMQLMTAGMNFAAGGTGLSGKSDQKFYEVPDLEYNQSDVVTINLRLVEDKDGNIREMKSATSNSVPEPV